MIDREAVTGNILGKSKLNMYKFVTLSKKLDNPVDRTEWGESSVIVNAFYTPTKNQVVFPTGILRPPMFNSSNHPAQNFGAIGSTIGYELTHSFDSKGRLFDGDGNLKSWWTSVASDEFDACAKYLREQYSKFVMRGENDMALMNVNGNLMIGENIADNGGMAHAYDAYQKYMKSLKTVVPAGAKLSEAKANKSSFIAFGQDSCGKSCDRAMKVQFTSDPHAASQWRVNGPAMNSEVLAIVFQCKADTKMNPTKKCVLCE